MSIRTVLLGAALALLVAACGGDKKYYVPVDSPIKPFEAPEAAELTGEESDPLAEPVDDEEDFVDPMAEDEPAKPEAKAPEAPKAAPADAKAAAKPKAKK